MTNVTTQQFHYWMDNLEKIFALRNEVEEQSE